MDIDEQHELTYDLHQTNALAGPSTSSLDAPALFLPYPAPPRPPPYFKSTDELIRRFNLLPAYDKYVRPYAPPVVVNGQQIPTSVVIDKGKGKERETASPAPTPAPGHDGDDEDGKVDKKWKTYRHLIKGTPGKHSMKKDDYLTTIMQVPPKQRVSILPFDLRTQREAFSVSLEGLKGWNANALIAESPQAREDRKKRKELRKAAKQGLLPVLAGTGTPTTPTTATMPAMAPTPAASVTAPGHPPMRQGTPKPGTNKPTMLLNGQSRGRTPVGIGTPRSVSTPNAGPGPVAQSAQVPASTSAPTLGQAGSRPDPVPVKKSHKRAREPTADANGAHAPVNGAEVSAKPVVGAKAGTGNIRPRPVKKQRVDMQGQAREMPIQQPTPHS